MRQSRKSKKNQDVEAKREAMIQQALRRMIRGSIQKRVVKNNKG